MPARRTHDIVVDYLDLQTGPPYASIQVIYRPRGKFVFLPLSFCLYVVQSY